MTLGAHRLPHRVRTDGRAEQMDVHHLAELRHRHLGEAFVAQDTGIVDEDVDPAPARQRRRNHGRNARLVGHRAGRDHRFAAALADLGHDGGGTVGRDVVDDEAGALSGEEQGVRATQSGAGAGDDRNTVLKGLHARPCSGTLSPRQLGWAALSAASRPVSVGMAAS
ncbi:hypothetical protein GCM10011380_33980 [Sphingomonas metalli]|uniref:Uncharacterized protein n=1 Tax=Sphingomonas metalli TaxID=1779358 RepID=A0A916WYZ7_9SPHN|nr:hypothetical protein GCM10011380_33980 [Sphingomonas metalli]